MTVLQALQRRRSIPKFEPEGLLLTRETIEELIEDACLAPSDFNLQPWRFIVVRDREKKEILYDCAHKQEKVRQASAVVIVCGDAYGDRRAAEEAGAATKAGAMAEAEVPPAHEAYTAPEVSPEPRAAAADASNTVRRRAERSVRPDDQEAV